LSKKIVSLFLKKKHEYLLESKRYIKLRVGLTRVGFNTTMC